MLHDCRTCRHMGNDVVDRCRGCWTGGVWRRWEPQEDLDLGWYRDSELVPEDLPGNRNKLGIRVIATIILHGRKVVEPIMRVNTNRGDGWHWKVSQGVEVAAWMPWPKAFESGTDK